MITWLRLLPRASALFLARSTVCSSIDSVTFMNTVYVRADPVSRSDDRRRCHFRRSGTLCLHRLNNRVSEFRGAGGAANISSEFAAVAIDLVNRVADFQGRLVLAEMAQHEQGGSQHGGGSGDVFSAYVGCGPMHGFKDGALVAEIRSGNEAKAANQSRAQIGKNVAV